MRCCLREVLTQQEMTRRDVTIKQLAELIGENERGLANKISRGGFTATFMLQCLDTIDVREVRLF